MPLGSLGEYLKGQFAAKLGTARGWRVRFFNHRTENAGRDLRQQPLDCGYSVRDLAKGPLGGAEHLKLRKTRHKNVRVSPDCGKNLELMMDLLFENEVAFKAFKDGLYNRDFIGLDAKKYFLRGFIEDETNKALRLFEPDPAARGLSQRDFSNSLRRSIDKLEISHLAKPQFLGSQGEASCSQLFQLNDTNRLNSNQFLAESNLFLLGDSKKNSLGFFRGQDSQFMSLLQGRETPGDPSHLLAEAPRHTHASLKNKRADNSNLLELTPVKPSSKKGGGFRDLKANPMFLKDDRDRPASNFIYQKEDASGGFELTQRELANQSQRLGKRAAFFEGRPQKRETPVYDFKNVTQKIYEVDNLKKLKKERKPNRVSEDLEIFFQETDRMSRKENKRDPKKKPEENVSFGEKDNSNIGNYSNSVNTRKSTKKYEEGLLNLYSKV